jgi:hypothetical protein
MVLNPQLYNGLSRVFGHAPRISRHGEHAVFARNAEGAVVINDWGERYSGNCPFCQDTKERCAVAHNFGRRNEAGYRCLEAHCYNDTLCLHGSENQHRREHLYLAACGAYPSRRRGRFVAYTEEPATPLRPVSLPVGTCRLSDLPSNHPAQAYLVGRGFDPFMLEEKYGVGYHDVHYGAPYLDNRLIIPVRVNGELAMWQSRHVPPFPNAVPKHFNTPGAPKNRLLYGYDLAKTARLSFVVDVEGVTDV